MNKMTLITSPGNPRISKLRDLHTTRGRKKSGLFLMEGIHLLEALLDAGIVPQEVYYQAEVLQHSAKGRALFARLMYDSGISHEGLVEVNERVMQALGDVQTTPGVVSVLPLELFKADRLRARRPAVKRPCLLILDDRLPLTWILCCLPPIALIAITPRWYALRQALTSHYPSRPNSPGRLSQRRRPNIVGRRRVCSWQRQAAHFCITNKT